MQIMQIKCKKQKKIKKTVDISANLYYTYVRNRDEAWLSLVERCVRDAEVASSNLVASTYLNTKACWSSGQDDALSRRKPGFDSRTGHLLLRYAAAFFKGASVAQLVEQRIRNAQVAGSSPAGSLLMKGLSHQQIFFAGRQPCFMPKWHRNQSRFRCHSL